MDELEALEFEVVTASSVRSFEVILYPPNATIEKALEVIVEHGIKEYAMILHDRDDKKPHIHCMCWLNNPTPRENVLKWFAELGATETNYGRIKNKKGALAYLTHSTKPNKAQYDISEVVRSSGIREELETATNEALRKREIRAMCDRVALGEISPRELYATLTGVEIRENSKLILGSVDARLLKSTAKKERNMKVVYITGKAGTGKSTLARWFAFNWSKEPPYISSSSNDPLQDYLLEPVIILDDFRANAFAFADLLKLTDNYVSSSVKCRYKNKTIDAQYLIITSTRKLEELYDASVFQKDDNLEQLKRRISAMYEIGDNGEVYQTQYIQNEKKHRWEACKLAMPVTRMSLVFQNMQILQSADDFVSKMADLFLSLGK